MIKIVMKEVDVKADVWYLKDLRGLHSYLPFLSETMKICKAITLYAICMIKKYIAHIRSLKEALDHRNNRRFWIWKNKCIIEVNKQPAR